MSSDDGTEVTTRTGSEVVTSDGTEVVTSDGTEVERFTNPGLPPHSERLSDTDPEAERRVVRQVVLLFGISALGAIGMLVAYFAVPTGETVGSMRLSNLLLGLGLFLALFGFGAAAIHWAKALMSNVDRIEDRHPQASSSEERSGAVAALNEGAADSGIERRSVLKGALVGGLALIPLTIAVPLVGEAGGDWNVGKFRHTLWTRGKRLTKDPSGEPIRAAEVTVGSVFHVIPEGLRDSEHWLEEKAKAVVIMVRINPDDLTEASDRRDWSYEGIVAYSKICTHVGCPVALYEQQTHHVLCPCHQSTFDFADGARVIFGPASRALPQLPITVDAEGYLIAQDDFAEPIGPSYWERLK